MNCARKLKRIYKNLEEGRALIGKSLPVVLKNYREENTKSGKKAVVEYILNESKIAEKEKYDGYYMVATNLTDSAKDILYPISDTA